MSRDDLNRRVAALPWARPADDDPGEPMAGDMWRASWGTTHLLVLLTAVDTDTVRVVVVTGDDAGDENTAVLQAEQSALPGVQALVWLGVAADLPHRVLDQRLGRVYDEFLYQPGVSPFPPITSSLDARAFVRADVEDRLEVLAGAEWQPADTGPGLRDLTGVPPGRFAQEVKMLPGDAAQVYERARPLESELVERTARIYGLSVEQVVSAASPRIPADVVALFDHPRRGRSIRQRAQATGVTEVDVMRTITSGVLVQAARTAGHEQPDWGALIDDVLGD